MVEEGKVYDLCLAYDLRSYKFEGHNPDEIVSFLTPDGLNTQEDIDFVTAHSATSTKAIPRTPTTATAQRTFKATSGS